MPEQKSLGENIVRTTFNPSDNSTVQHIKERAAEFINYIESELKYKEAGHPSNEEIFRLKLKSIDAIELAAMYAVKAATA